MKKMLMLAVMLLIASPVFAQDIVKFTPSFERLEFDVNQPIHIGKSVFSQFENYHTLTVSADVRLNVLDTKLGIFGIEGTPSYDFSDSIISSNVGVYYRPFGIKYVEVHYDHASNVPVANLSGIRFTGTDSVGVRLIIFDK